MFNFSVEKTTKSTAFETVGLWDMLIIGAGPAGLNAALYAKRKGLEVGVLVDEMGGQLHNTTTVDNYLGYTMVDGEKLSDHFVDHVKSLDVPILKGVRVDSLKKEDNKFFLKTNNGVTYQAKTVLLSTGGAPRKLNIPGETELANKGVTYCATCDAPFFKDKHVIVSGGGNSAAEAVLDLVPFAKKITVVHRSQWRADKILLSKLTEVDKLNVCLETQILEVLGESRVTGVKVLDKATNKTRTIEADGLLIEIGNVPNSYLVKDFVAVNARDEVVVDQDQMTSVEGLYAAGDVTNQAHKQIIIAAAEGAKAALAANHYINQIYKGE